MKDIINQVVKVFGWIVLLAAFSAIGFMTDRPKVMIPLYFVFFIIVFALVLLYNIKWGRKKNIGSKYLTLTNKIIGIALVIAAILTPSFIFKDVGFTAGIHSLMALIALALIALGFFAVMLINKNESLYVWIGRLLLVIVCSLPALIMMQYDRSYHALGLAYYGAIAVGVLSWSGINMFIKNIKS